MQHSSRHFVGTLVALTIAMAAPTAPPSVFARTAEAAAPTLRSIAAAAPAPALKPAPPGPANAIRIGLGRSQSTVDLTAPGGVAIVNAGVIQWQSAPNQAVRLTLSGTQIQVAGLAKGLTGPVRVVPVAPAGYTIPGVPIQAPGEAPPNPISYNRKPYRGEFEVLINTRDRRLSVVNVLNLEDYVMGVVPKEMPTGWPAEALKAQAVASRTFGVRNRGKYPDEGFDLVDTVMDQAYGGLSGERPSTVAAVVATIRQLVTYNGQVAGVLYFASSGGHTENNEVIFQSAPIPYLRGVPDYDNMPGNTRYAWTYTYTPEEFAQKLAAASYNIGPVVGADAAGLLGSSGRPSRWSLRGLLGSKELTAQQVRAALALPSAVRTITVKSDQPVPPVQPGNGGYSYQPGDQVYVVGADGVPRTRTVEASRVVGASGGLPHLIAGAVSALGSGGQPTGITPGPIPNPPPPPTPAAGVVEVVGGGYGHAVGMSQWGAYGMAAQGNSYIEILTHYYQGTKVEVR